MDQRDGFYAGMPAPCSDGHASACLHGQCEIRHSVATCRCVAAGADANVANARPNFLDRCCRCDAGYKGVRCDEPQEFNSLYVVPSGQKLHYILIAAIIGAVQIAIIVAVVMCITRWGAASSLVVACDVS